MADSGGNVSVSRALFEVLAATANVLGVIDPHMAIIAKAPGIIE